ncbi:MAG: hypothetical protein ABIF87_04465 [Pseudomonadota bacterium]
MYVGVMMLFAVSPDLPISFSNSVSGRFGWSVLPSVGERFWFSLALTVPGMRAVLAFTAARYPVYERVFINLLQASLIIAAASFAFHFIFYERALLYAIGFGTEIIQIVFYCFLMSRLKRRSQ